MAVVAVTVPIFVDLVGESTGESYQGDFVCKLRLSSRDRFQKDSVRRSLLGDRPEAASGDALVRAEMFSHLSVSLTETPPWWREAGNGLDLYDDNVLLTIYERVTNEQENVSKAAIEKAEAAKAELRDAAKTKKAKLDKKAEQE